MRHVKSFLRLSSDKQSIRVSNRDGSQIGYVLNEIEPYQGEAGFSRRFSVVWSDGKLTFCAVRGLLYLNETAYQVR